MAITSVGGQGCAVLQVMGFSPLYPQDIYLMKQYISTAKKNGRMILCTITDTQIKDGGELMQEMLEVMREAGFVQAARWKSGVHAPWNMCTTFMWWNADIAEEDKKEYLPVNAAAPAVTDSVIRDTKDTIAAIRKQLTALNRKL